MTARRTMLTATFLVAAPFAGARAQEECRIDENRPGEIRDARNAIVTRELAGTPEDKQKNFVRAVNLLTRQPERLRGNMIGRNMFLGRALVNLALLPDMPDIARRGDLGFTENPDGTIDMLAAADTAFDAVEAEQPACAADTEEIRRRPYIELLNEAVNFYNARETDSAEVKARRSLMIYGDNKMAHFAYNVLGNVQQAKDDIKGAIASFRKMTDLQAGDTSVVEDRKSAMIMTAQLMTNEGELLEGDARKAAMAEVVSYLDGYLREYPGDIRAQSAIARAQILSGDEAAARRLFDEMLASPDKYDDMNLFEAGVGAARADQNEVAAQLFRAGLRKNPYSRDGLFNLAAVMDAMEQYDSMPPVLKRLIEVDPENPENHQLWARYWQGVERSLRPASEGKESGDPAVVARQQAIDSLTKYVARFQEAPVKVTFNLFSHDGGRHVLAGSVENRADDTKSYTLKFDFLDAAGNVVDSREVPVEEVAGKSVKSFRVEVLDKPGVVAFKYAPFP